jgi:hypothetical protein
MREITIRIFIDPQQQWRVEINGSGYECDSAKAAADLVRRAVMRLKTARLMKSFLQT